MTPTPSPTSELKLTNKLMTKKFKLTEKTKEEYGITFHRIKALIDFGNVSKGDKGGFVEKEGNVSQTGDAWVFGDAEVSGDARVFGDADRKSVV